MHTHHTALSFAPNIEPPLAGCAHGRTAGPPMEQVRRCRASPGESPSRHSATTGLRRALHEGHAATARSAAGRSGVDSRADTHHVTVVSLSAARQFADRSLRVVLEVLDRRRPVRQLSALADAPVVASVHTLVSGGLVPGCTLGTAVLARVGVVMVDMTTAEVFAAYDRGTRHFALAARIARTRTGWRLTALRVR